MVKEAAAEETTQKAEILKDVKLARVINNQLKDETSNVDRKAWSWWSLLWLLIPAGLIALFYKYSAKIWWF